MNKNIALDCDQVLLDYIENYGVQYQKYFNCKLDVADPDAYEAKQYWGISWNKITKEEKLGFFDFFDNNGWLDMPAIPGAVEATHIFKEHGFNVHIVSRMPAFAEAHRVKNLKKLGFYFDSVIGTGDTDEYNPKKPFIEKLNPLYFVDDLIKNFHSIENNTEFVWLDIGKYHHENEEFKKIINPHHTFDNLLNFAKNLYLSKS